jgi:uncharacterized coiled-coil protein SlyX
LRPADESEKKLREARALAASQEQEIERLKASIAIHEKSNRVGAGDSHIAMKATLAALEEKAGQQETTIKALKSEVAALQEQLTREAADHAATVSRLGGGTQPLGDASSAPRERRAIPRLTLAERVAQSRRDAEGAANDAGESDGSKIAPAPEAAASSARDEDVAAPPNTPSDGAATGESKEAGEDRRNPRIKSRLLDRISNLSKA